MNKSFSHFLLDHREWEDNRQALANNLLGVNMDKLRVVVAGGRLFTDFTMLTKTLDNVLRNKSKTNTIVIVSGKARGADRLGEKYAKLRGYEIQYHEADWNGLGKSAGYRRNEEMAENSDATVAFWDGESKGTKHMIDLTKKYGNDLLVAKYAKAEPEEVAKMPYRNANKLAMYNEIIQTHHEHK